MKSDGTAGLPARHGGGNPRGFSLTRAGKAGPIPRKSATDRLSTDRVHSDTLCVVSSKANKEILRLIGDNIIRLREDRGWSQEELAFRCGLHRTYIGAVERGERNVGVLNVLKIAKSLGVGPDELLSGVP